MIERYNIEYSLKSGLGKPSINLYLTGCDIPVKCKGCHNWELQEQNQDKYDIIEIWNNLNENIKKFKLFHKNLYVCLLGGDPLADFNLDISKKIVKNLKDNYPDCKIVVYSWHTDIYIKGVDYGVLGAYNEDLYINNQIPSSSNQYIWDYNNQLKLDDIKLKKGND